MSKTEWKEIYRTFREGTSVDEYTGSIVGSCFYAYSERPKDPLKRSITTRLQIYRAFKRGPNPDIPF